MPYVTLTGLLTELRKEGYVEDLNLYQHFPGNDVNRAFPGDF